MRVSAAGLVGASLIWAIGCSDAAFASPVTYAFTARVNYSWQWLSDPAVQIPGYVGPIYPDSRFDGVQVGQVLQGRFTFDTEATKTLDVPGRADYRSGPEPGTSEPGNIFYLEVDLGGQAYRSLNTEITVHDEANDRYDVVGRNASSGAPSYFTAALGMGDAYGNLFSSTNLPAVPPDLAAVDYAMFSLNYYVFVASAGTYYEPYSVGATVLSIDRVPTEISEPASAWLGGIAAAALLLASRRTRAFVT